MLMVVLHGCLYLNDGKAHDREAHRRHPAERLLKLGNDGRVSRARRQLLEHAHVPMQDGVAENIIAMGSDGVDARRIVLM